MSRRIEVPKNCADWLDMHGSRVFRGTITIDGKPRSVYCSQAPNPQGAIYVRTYCATGYMGSGGWYYNEGDANKAMKQHGRNWQLVSDTTAGDLDHHQEVQTVEPIEGWTQLPLF